MQIKLKISKIEIIRKVSLNIRSLVENEVFVFVYIKCWCSSGSASINVLCILNYHRLPTSPNTYVIGIITTSEG
jgi:hypothetical protein